MGQSSGMGIMLGKRVASPYTVADEEKTMLETLCFVIEVRRHTVPQTLVR